MNISGKRNQVKSRSVNVEMDLEAGTSAKGVDLVKSPMFRPDLSITIVTEQRAQQEEQQSCHLSDA